MNQTAFHLDATGLSLFAFPLSASLADYSTERVSLSEAASPDAGRYSASLDDTKGLNWAVFDGSTQPTEWSLSRGVIQLEKISALFLDTPVPADWVVPISDRSTNFLDERLIEVRKGERYIAAWECSAIMAKGQNSLYGFDLPTTDSSVIDIIATVDAANPQHGTAGRYAKFQFEVSPSATVGEHVVKGVVRPTEFSRNLPEMRLKVVE